MTSTTATLTVPLVVFDPTALSSISDGTSSEVASQCTSPNYGASLASSNEPYRESLSGLDLNGHDRSAIEQLTVEVAVTNNTLRSPLSRGQTVLLITTLAGITFASSMSTGLFTIGIPVIAVDLALADNLLLWPASVCSLASGCTLLLAGSIADFAGNRMMNLCGCFLLGIFILASGLARTGLELIIFRAFQGIAISMCFPTSFSILTDAFPNGRRRNIAFASLGLVQPLGWSVGLFLGGFLEETSLRWRFGFYLCAGGCIILACINCWMLPKDIKREPFSWMKLSRGIDWVGIILSSACLGILSYVLAVITGSLSSIRDAPNIILLCIAIPMIPAFGFWMNHQEKLGRPALIPNSIWKNPAFTAICIMVLLSWAALQSIELFLSLYFQKVNLVSAIQTSIRFLPNIIIGVILNISTGLLVHRVRANHLVLITSAISILSPLLMAIINPLWSWWYCAFWAVLFSPLSADVIFTVANLIITDVFPPTTQALAGAVFNTVAQFGTTIGLTVTAVIAATVTSNSKYEVKQSPNALMQGYRAVFWTCFAAMVVACGAGAVGLRKVGKVGLKRE